MITKSQHCKEFLVADFVQENKSSDLGKSFNGSQKKFLKVQEQVSGKFQGKIWSFLWSKRYSYSQLSDNKGRIVILFLLPTHKLLSLAIVGRMRELQGHPEKCTSKSPQPLQKVTIWSNYGNNIFGMIR